MASSSFRRVTAASLTILSVISSANGYSSRSLKKATPCSPDAEPSSSSRRRVFALASTALVAPLASFLPPAPPSAAFENRLDDRYADATPQSGTQPGNLGVSSRTSKKEGSYSGLAPCPSSPNCWCSSAPFGDNPARYLPAWKGGSITEVKSVIDSYEVGQQGIDGGGFKVVDYNEGDQYLYVQFQSYKAGYIDDVEFWYNPQKGLFDVRSASRIGMSDLGVNAKRLNYIGSRLEKEFGWELERRKNGSLV